MYFITYGKEEIYNANGTGFLLSHRTFPWTLLHGWDPLCAFCNERAAWGLAISPRFP